MKPQYRSDTKEVTKDYYVSFASRHYCDTVTSLYIHFKREILRTYSPSDEEEKDPRKLGKGSSGEESRESWRDRGLIHFQATSLISIPSTHHEDFRHRTPRYPRNCRCWQASIVGKIHRHVPKKEIDYCMLLNSLVAFKI